MTRARGYLFTEGAHKNILFEAVEEHGSQSDQTGNYFSDHVNITCFAIANAVRNGDLEFCGGNEDLEFCEGNGNPEICEWNGDPEFFGGAGDLEFCESEWWP